MDTHRLSVYRLVFGGALIVLLITAVLVALRLVISDDAPIEAASEKVEDGGVHGGVYPRAEWEMRSPEAVGMDPGRLEEFEDLVGLGSFGCVVKDGYLVHRWGPEWLRFLPPASFRGWASATKPFIGVLLLFAVDEGKIPDLDYPVRDAGWDLRPDDRDMTLRRLVDMTSGYGLPEPPGAAFAYNDYGVKLLFLTVLERIYEVESDDTDAVEEIITHPKRLGPLQFEDEGFLRVRHDAPRLDMTPCDYARFGLLIMRRGRWRGEQILPESLIEVHLRPAVPETLPLTAAQEVDDYLEIGTAGGGHDESPIGPGVYGFYWWFNAGGRLWPDVPEDAFQANGHWNRHALTVIPSLDLVVAWRASRKLATEVDSFPARMNRVLEVLVSGVDHQEDIVVEE